MGGNEEETGRGFIIVCEKGSVKFAVVVDVIFSVIGEECTLLSSFSRPRKKIL